MSCVQFELRVEYCSIVKTVEGITAGQVHRLYAGKRGKEGLPFNSPCPFPPHIHTVWKNIDGLHY